MNVLLPLVTLTTLGRALVSLTGLARGGVAAGAVPTARTTLNSLTKHLAHWKKPFLFRCSTSAPAAVAPEVQAAVEDAATQ